MGQDRIAVLLYGTHHWRKGILIKALGMLDTRFSYFKDVPIDWISKLSNEEIPVIHIENLSEINEIGEKLPYKVIRVFIWEPIEVLEKRLDKLYPDDPEVVKHHMEKAKEELLHLSQENISNLFDQVVQDDKSPVDTGLELIYNLEERSGFQDDLITFNAYIHRL
ncbi:guanylate kinase [Evansella vedderi]|uniref:Guanylate kinase n=1 Tax=Evansella vedderi TaxID=38282 RepID=A0ABU0A1E2_9BACI|nr:hypothetical protein [Evansella vedderi]MDQ0256796.1 guanylate kinase [Evansella vedderi]